MDTTVKTLCALPFDRIKIDSDGKFQSCCYQTGYYGNILNPGSNIVDDFKNLKLRKVKNDVLNGKLHKICDNIECPIRYESRDRREETTISKYPKQIEIALPSTWCNIGGLKPTPDTACIMCPRSSVGYMSQEYHKVNITDKIIEYIKPAIPHIDYLSVLGIAEPFYKGIIFDMLDKLEFKKYKDNIFFWTFCNGTLFGEKNQDKFLTYMKKCNFGFSVDAATPETYKKIRRLNYFDTIERNLTTWFKKVKDSEVQDYSFIYNNINMLNVHEMSDMVRFAKKVGAYRLQLNPTFITSHDMALPKNMICNESNWEIFWEAQLKAEEVAKELDMKLTIWRPFHLGYLNK